MAESDPSLLIPGLLVAMLFASAFCSGSETALFSINRGALRQGRDDAVSAMIGYLLANSERLLLAILTVNNAINIAFFALASYWASLNPELSTLSMSILALSALIVVGEIIPKVLASERPMIVGRLVAPLWLIIIRLLGPLLRCIEYVLQPLLHGQPAADEFPEVGAEELKLVIEQSHREGVVSTYVHDRLVDVIDLSQVPVHKVMTHRLDCCSIPRSANHEEAVAALRARPSAYLLVLDDHEDCIGILGAQHLLRGGKPTKRMIKPLILPAAATLAQTLELFQKVNATAGIVVDEFGGTDGLLTLAHLAAVLLGDEREDPLGAVRVEQLDVARWRLSGNAPIAPWKSLLNAPQLTNEVATIGGFLALLSGSIPQTNDRLLFNNLLFVVEETEGRRVKTLLVEKLAPQEARRLTQAGSL